uniref:Prolyl 4-hydroxylase alpha-subunit N-terminal domain-containing protein n=1 Tax=Clastoptera arizonana TaxID=38151 RepID=A0A1B6CUU8_9HEMI
MNKVHFLIMVLLINSYSCIKLVNEVYQRMTSLDESIRKMLVDPVFGKGNNLTASMHYYMKALYEIRKEIRIGNKEIMPQAEKLFQMDRPGFVLDRINETLLTKMYLWEGEEIKYVKEMSEEVHELWVTAKRDYNSRKAYDIKEAEMMKNSNFTEQDKVQDWWDKWDIPELDTDEDIQLKNFKILFD